MVSNATVILQISVKSPDADFAGGDGGGLAGVVADDQTALCVDIQCGGVADLVAPEDADLLAQGDAVGAVAVQHGGGGAKDKF